uniref:Uncharacterized protein n=2 Tax=Guillardia theta TaxID=55529 RepID=A0A7S4H9A8_GUITH|mmetsp:Transcript_11239/g.38343  ORF Transcript_11239/g.38343 Transcript_11239/m.38343 type:complete len:358 (+) Transcript_11239:161-1234(+)
MDFVYTQLDSKKGPKILKVNPVTKELEKVSKSKENGSSPPDAKVASKKKGEAKSSKKRPLDGSAGTEQDAKRPKPTAGKALGLKNAPKPQAPSQSNAHPPEVKKSSDSIAKKQQMDAKAASLHAKLKEVVKVKRPPARMKDVDSAFNELEAAIESRSSSRVAHEIKELDKIKILPLILNLTQAPSRLQMALQKIQSQPGLGATVTEGKQILDKWHLTLGKYMAKYNMVTGDYEGKQQLISLADKANVRKIGLKLAEKFVTVDAVPLLSESVWKQIGASKNDRFRILSALPQELQNLIEGGIEAWKPQTGGRTSKVNVTYDKEYVPQQLVEVELKVHNLFEKAMHKVSASLAALASNH